MRLGHSALSRHYLTTMLMLLFCFSVSDQPRADETTIALDAGAPTTLHVAINGSDITGDGSAANPYATINYAIDQALDDDTVLIGPGEFSERIYISKSLVIFGSGARETVTLGATIQDTVSGCLSHLTMASNVTYPGTVSIYPEVVSWRIRDAIIGSNGGTGLRTTGSHVEIQRVIFEGSQGYNGAYIGGGNTVRITNSIFSGFSYALWFGSPSYDWRCDNSIFIENAVAVLCNTNATLLYNCFHDNVIDIRDDCPGYSANNLYVNPLFMGGEPFDYGLTCASPCVDAGNPDSPPDPDGTRADIGAFYLDASICDTSPDSDGDGYCDACDGCPTDSAKLVPGVCGCGEVETGDLDGDGLLDCIDPDDDNDIVADSVDNCPHHFQFSQTDTDGDGIGNACDNCVSDYNPDQRDYDEDGIGDACDGCCILAGDVNSDASVNISDITAQVEIMFSGGAAPYCCAHLDTNTDGVFNIADVTTLVQFLFLGAASPPCGVDGDWCK